MRVSSLLLLACVAGCGGNGKSGDAGSGAASDMAAAPAVGMLCSDARADAWQLPITKPSASGALQVTLLSSQAAIPVIGDSTTTWTLKIVDGSGAPVTGATVTALPYMPDHHHGTSVVASVRAGANAGEYAVEPLYFFMAGYWTVTFGISQGADGGAADSVVFSLCLTDA